MGFLTGYKTYLTAAGLAGLGLYQLSTGDVQGGIQSVLAAAGVAGLRSALATAAKTSPPAPTPRRPGGF